MKKAKKPRSKSPSKASKRRKAAPKVAAAKAKKAARTPVPVHIPASPSPDEISSLDTEAIFEQDAVKDQSQFDIQAGDLEGLSRKEIADSESVEELADEGQDREGEIVEAIEEAPDPDQGEVPTPRAPRRGPTPYKDRNRL